MCASFGSLAQLVEQLAFNQLVIGSNPIRPTKSYGLSANWNWSFFWSNFKIPFKLISFKNNFFRITFRHTNSELNWLFFYWYLISNESHK